MKLHNHFDFYVNDRKVGHAENIVLNNTLAVFSGSRSYVSESLKNIALGSGTVEPTVNDTSLTAQLGSYTANTTRNVYEQDKITRELIYELQPGELAGKFIGEVGLATGRNILCTKALIKDSTGNPITIEKLATEKLKIVATVYIMRTTPEAFFADVPWINFYPRDLRLAYSAGYDDTTSAYTFIIEGLHPLIRGVGAYGVSEKIISTTGLNSKIRLDTTSDMNGKYINGIYSSWHGLSPFMPIGDIDFNNIIVGKGDGITSRFDLHTKRMKNIKAFINGLETKDITIEESYMDSQFKLCKAFFRCPDNNYSDRQGDLLGPPTKIDEDTILIPVMADSDSYGSSSTDWKYSSSPSVKFYEIKYNSSTGVLDTKIKGLGQVIKCGTGDKGYAQCIVSAKHGLLIVHRMGYRSNQSYAFSFDKATYTIGAAIELPTNEGFWYPCTDGKHFIRTSGTGLIQLYKYTKVAENFTIELCNELDMVKYGKYTYLSGNAIFLDTIDGCVDISNISGDYYYMNDACRVPYRNNHGAFSGVCYNSIDDTIEIDTDNNGHYGRTISKNFYIDIDTATKKVSLYRRNTTELIAEANIGSLNEVYIGIKENDLFVHVYTTSDASKKEGNLIVLVKEPDGAIEQRAIADSYNLPRLLGLSTFHGLQIFSGFLYSMYSPSTWSSNSSVAVKHGILEYQNKTLVFNNPPPVDATITISYQVDTILKSVDNMIDFTPNMTTTLES